jgi:hypothetical protein
MFLGEKRQNFFLKKTCMISHVKIGLVELEPAMVDFVRALLLAFSYSGYFLI